MLDNCKPDRVAPVVSDPLLILTLRDIGDLSDRLQIISATEGGRGVKVILTIPDKGGKLQGPRVFPYI